MARKPRIRMSRDLSQAASRFALWRRKGHRRPFPAELWAVASGLAVRHGVHATAQALNLDYYSLKRRVALTPGKGPAAPFVELPAHLAQGAHCVLDVWARRGLRVRLELRQAGAAEIEALWRLVSGVRG